MRKFTYNQDDAAYLFAADPTINVLYITADGFIFEPKGLSCCKDHCNRNGIKYEDLNRETFEAEMAKIGEAPGEELKEAEMAKIGEAPGEELKEATIKAPEVKEPVAPIAIKEIVTAALVEAVKESEKGANDPADELADFSDQHPGTDSPNSEVAAPEVKEPVPQAPVAPEVWLEKDIAALKKLKLDELEELATKKGVKFPDGATKAVIIELITKPKTA